MKKRIVALFLTLLLMISLIPTMPVSAATTEEVQLIRDLGIVEEMESSGLVAASYSRSRFAKSLVMMTNTYAIQGAGIVDAAGDGDRIIFLEGGRIETIKGNDGEEVDETLAFASDITDDINSPSIMQVIQNGYMETDAEKKFNPTDPVTKMDATRALIRILNYDEMAEENGGTDADYLNVAAKLGLFRRVVIANEERLTSDEVAGMIANAMSIQIYYGEGVDLKDTCFFDVWALSKHSGRLIANSSLGLMVEKAPKNYVNVSGELFYTSILIPNELVGSQVTFYTRSTDKGEAVVSIYSDGDSEAVTLNADEIENVTQNGNIITLTFNEDETLKVTTRGYALVNGKTMSPSKSLFSALNCGTVTFVDSNYDGVYDVIHMELLETLMIGSVASDYSKIITKFYKQTIEFDGYDAIEIYLNNKEASVEKLEAGMIVNVACDTFSIVNGKVQSDFANSKNIKIYGKTKLVNGCVVSIKGNQKLFIDDMDYEFGSLYQKLVADGHIQPIKLGDYINAWFDSMGRLAYYEVDKTQGKVYGYLIGTGQLQQGLSNVLDFRILTTEGKYCTISAADKFILDGSSINKKDVSLIYLAADGSTVDLTKRQIVRYRVDNDGLLRELDTAAVCVGESVSDSLKQDLVLDPYGTGASQVKITNGIIGKQWAFADNCVAFVDDAPLTSGMPDERLIQCVDYSSVSGSRYLAGYDANAKKELSCVVAYSTYGSTSGTDKKNGLSFYGYYCYVVDSIARTVDADGAPAWNVKLVGCRKGFDECTISSSVTRLYVTTNNETDWGKEYSWVQEEDVQNFMSLVGPGDIVRFRKNFFGQVDHFERLFDFSEYGTSLIPRYNAGGQTMCFANIEAAYENGLVVYSFGDATVYPSTETYLFKKIADAPKATLYNVAKGEVTQVEYKDLPSALTGETTRAFIRYYDHDSLVDYIFYVYE